MSFVAILEVLAAVIFLDLLRSYEPFAGAAAPRGLADIPAICAATVITRNVVGGCVEHC